MLHLKSIDVGSMFLMDLSVHESDLNETNAFNSTIIDTDSVFPKTNLSSSQKNIIDTKNSPTTTTYDHLNSISGYSLNDISKNNHKKQQTQPSSCEKIAYHRSTQGNYNLGNSLDRLASAINGSPLNDEELIDHQNQFKDNLNNDEIDDIGGKEEEEKISQVTIVEPQPPPEIENQFSSASSLSDESYVASSGSATSYTASCESVGADDYDDRGSTTTREDSGVLDIKDLGNHHFSNSYDNEDICQQQQQRFDHQNQEKAISNNVMATNLINKSANNIDQNSSALIQQNFSSSIINTNTNNMNMNNKPTNNHFNHQNHHHNHSHRNTSFSQPQRSMSASLPIEVPPRQMKRELKKSKKDYKNQTDNNNKAQEVKNSKSVAAAAAAATNSKQNIDDVLDDDFLDQEYNENHQNHYPIDEFDEEPLRAEENPMKLFESIQALARSLHEDAELFGSLPPKRMLESPIRSLIFS